MHQSAPNPAIRHQDRQRHPRLLWLFVTSGALALLTVGILNLYAALHRRQAPPSLESAAQAEADTPVRRPSRALTPAYAAPSIAPTTAQVGAAAKATANQNERSPQEPVDPRMERDDLLERLHGSGAASGSWTTEASEVFHKWHLHSPRASLVDVGRVDCFAEGCAATMTYRDLPGFQSLAHEFLESEPFKSWHGPKFRSAPIAQTSGAVEATWILYHE